MKLHQPKHKLRSRYGAMHAPAPKQVIKKNSKKLLGSVFDHLDWRHPNFHSVAPLVLALFLALVGVTVHVLSPDFYKLSAASEQLIGPTVPQLSKQLSYDPTSQSIQYNKTAVSRVEPSGPQAALAAAGQSQKVGGGAKNFAVDLAVEARAGTKVHDTTDTSGSMAIQMIPQFAARDGKIRDGRVIYPLKGRGGALVYSVKANGLKEDLLIQKEQGDTASFSYQLKLPGSLEARLLPSGAVGIYSADPTLFGDISYGSDADRAKVEAARQQSEKTHLVFEIPAPVITQSDTTDSNTKASFELSGDSLVGQLLTVKATGLEHASYPLSIDPSVVVTSATDFSKGNVESGVEIDASNGQLKRGGLTGGSAPVQAEGTAFSTARLGHTTVAYNGYLYVIGGCTAVASGECSNALTNVQYGQIDGSGNVTSWTNTTNQLPVARAGHTSFVYNGYVYVVAGANQSAQCQNNVYYSKIAENGDLGAWTLESDTVLTAGTSRGAVAYNGYAYVMGGNCGSSYSPYVEFAPLKADGSTGAWHYVFNSTDYVTTPPPAPAGLPNSTSGAAVAVNNGYIYVMGGSSSNTPLRRAEVYYAPLNADGTVGTWATTTSLPAASYGQTGVAVGGYMYVFGGSRSGGQLGGLSSDSYYAQIDADGSLGPWRLNHDAGSGDFGAGRARASAAAYNGYIYMTGGYAGSAASNVERFKIDSAGMTSAYNAATAFPAATGQGAAVAYNGYLYYSGGWQGLTNKVRRATISSDGSIGAWSDETNTLMNNAYDHTMVAYNGYMYVLGGCTVDAGTSGGSGGLCGKLNRVQYAVINTNGTLGTWSATNNLPIVSGFANHASVAYNGYVYVIGGCQGTSGSSTCDTQSNNVYYALVCTGSNNGVGGCGTTAGALGTWSTTNNIGTVRAGHQAVVAAGRIYINSGNGNGSATIVRSALICTGQNNGVSGCTSTAGTVGTWRDETSLDQNRQNAAMVFINGYIYVSGGYSNTSASRVASTVYARVNADGTLEPWQTAKDLSSARSQVASAASGNYFYVIGGTTSGGYTTTVDYFQVNNGGGGTTAWTSGPGLGAPRVGGDMVIYNDYIYELGGRTHPNSLGVDSCLTTVQYSHINSDGSLAGWANTAPQTGQCATNAAFVYQGYIYQQGGNGDQFTYALVCDATNIGTDGCSTVGGLGTWHLSASPHWDMYRNAMSMTIYNGYVYLSGGQTGNNNPTVASVMYAPLTSGGGNGTWHYTGNDTDYGATDNAAGHFPIARRLHKMIAVNGYMYIVGGSTQGNPDIPIDDVQYAKINSNGTLGAWNKTTSLPEKRAGMEVLAVDGFMYAIGGTTTGFNANTRYAPINANGTLGVWQSASDMSMPGWLKQAEIYKGRMYVSGGTRGVNNAPNDSNHIDISTPSVIHRAGSYSWLSDLAGDAVATKLLVNGTIPISSQLTFALRDATASSATFGDMSTSGQVIPSSLYSMTAAEKRYRQLIFTFDDSTSAVFPDVIGPTGTVSDLTLYFHPATAKRLRGGKTFVNQSPTDLDAQPN